MAIKDQINADLKQAMIGKESERVTMIRGIMAAFKEADQKKREELVKQALKKHNVNRPTSSDEAAMSAYDKAVRGALESEGIGDKVEIDETEALTVVQKLIKMRQDSIADAEKANRKDIAETEKREMAWLQAYLPQQLSREEVEAEAKAVIAQVGASTAKDMGKVMGPLNAKLKGRADGKLISDAVKSLLA
jgi:uncharacterized protein YqeY